MGDLDLSTITKKKPIVLINDAYWEPKIKEWVPKLMINDLEKEQRKIIVQKRLVIVITPSNISKCSVCGKTIIKGEYRIGVPEYDRRGLYGIINRWNHINPCSQKFLKKIIQGHNSDAEKIEYELSIAIYGWDTLPIGMKDEIVELSIKEEITQSNEYTIHDSDNLVNRSVVGSRPTPINLTYDLLQFQKEGLEWMCNQENSAARGGILADEMGMGKTIQTISLFLEHDVPPITDEKSSNENEKELTGKNLVIAPVAAVLQWKQEIERFTKPGSLKVHVYHGSNRNKSKNNNQEYGVDIDQADVVITTYPTLEAEYRRVSSEFKYKCQYCDRLFLKRNLRLHLRYFCGPNARRTVKQALTERKNDGLRKAMNTLKIGLEDGVDKAKQLEEIAKSLPTISNVYREILAKADLLDDESLSSSIPWFVSRKRSSFKKLSEDSMKTNENKTVDVDKKPPYSIKRTVAVERETEVNPVEGNENVHLFLEWGGICLPLKKERLTSLKDFLSNIETSKDHLMSRFSLREGILNDLIELGKNLKKQKKDEIINQISNILGIKDNNIPQTIKSENKNSTYSETRISKNSNNNKNKKRRTSQVKSEKYNHLEDEDYNVEEEDESEDEFEDMDYKLNRKRSSKARKSKTISVRDDEYDHNANEQMIEVENDEYNDEDIELEEEEIINKLKEYSGIFERKWYRIVLDEAHRIKARTTSTAKAIFSLTCIGTKWCLTGTPLQNRVGELYSLVRFIGYHPYAYYFCQKNDCDCLQLNYVSHMKYCSKCLHARSCHYSFFNKMIINPIKRYGFSGEGSEALRRLKNDVLDKVLLRRTKLQRQEDVKLPPLEIKVLYNELSPPEKDFYTSIYQRSKIKFDTFVNQGTVLHNYAHVFDLISRLRQAVDHPYLIVYGKFNTRDEDGEYEEEQSTTSLESKKDIDGEQEENFNEKKKKNRLIPSKSRAPENEDLCYICMDNVTLDQRVTSKCKHGFHIKCIKEYVEQAPQIEEYITDSNMDKEVSMMGVLGCPVCYVPLTIDFNNILNNTKSSSLSDYENDADDNLESENQEIQIERDLERLEMAKKMGIIDNSNIESTSVKSEEEKEDDILISVRNKNIIRQIKTQGFESSTKIDRLIEEINRMINEDPESKGIVFSQFTNMLDLVSYRLKKSNIGCVMLAGSMSILQRNSILYSFNKFPDLKIILISLKAGGEGLNLQVANYVFLLDPWWNPAVELQAFQRAHRIGQKKKVMAIRFITKDTIEERMFQLQEKKQLVFDGTVGASNNALNKLNSDDLKFLFQN
ncbi:Swi2/Snf2 ATpase [Cryptosporidium ryanae]|uniref:Swi2/Snf2 ATpase n=1 Tax=Cryptosporidium ryanae TaxID=515981 RepID=UPI003519DCFD|nr:Swi2/Snf2 ATpase [Cryptosporidium ryanae]